MLIKGTPDILKPPATPLGMSGLDAVPRSDAGTAINLRTQFVQQYGQAALDRILSVWQSNAPDWEIVGKLRAMNNPDVHKAAGVQFEDFYAWWNTATAQESILQTFLNTAATKAQRAQTIRFVIANTPRFTTEQAAAAVGMSNTDFLAWLEGSEAQYANIAKAIMAAPLSDPQKAQMLESLAYKMGLSIADLARYLGTSSAQVSGLLSQAGATPTYAGGGIVAQATDTNPGAVLIGNSLAFIPAKSSRVVDAQPAADGSGSVVVTTVDGVTAEIAPGAAGLRTVPITPQAWGRLRALSISTALDYQAQSIAIYRALQELGVSNPAELNYWIPAGLDTVLQWLAVQGQTVVPPIEQIGIQPPSFSQDAALNEQFAAIFYDTSRSRGEKASAWVQIMRARGLGLNDVSRIVGVDARAVSEFLSSTDLAKSAEVPQLITVQTDIGVDFKTPENLFVPVYTRQVAPTGSGGEIPMISGNLAAMNAAQKAAEYLRLIDLGWADSQIRDAVTLDYGNQADSDWVALRNLAAAQRAADIAARAAIDAAAAATAQDLRSVMVADTARDAAQAAAIAADNAAAAADAGDTAGVASATTIAITASDTATNATSEMDALLKDYLKDPGFQKLPIEMPGYRGPTMPDMGIEYERGRVMFEPPTLPYNLNEMTLEQKRAAYADLIKQGYSDKEIRAAVEFQFGKQNDAQWAMLSMVKPVIQPAAGGGVAPLLVAVAAAYILGA